MSLGTALNSAVSSLRITQEAMSLVSNNITNANSEGYTRREITQTANVVNGEVAGAQIADVRRVVDDFLSTSARRQASHVGRTEAMDKYFDRIGLYYGQPGNENSLNVYADNFFAGLQELSNSPEEGYLRTNAVDDGVVLAKKVSELALNLENTRLDIDKEIYDTVGTLNSLLLEGQYINNAISDAARYGSDMNALYDKRDKLINDVSEIIDIETNFNSIGQMTLSVPRGEVLGPDQRFEFEYHPVGSVDDLINGEKIMPITYSLIDSNGNNVGTQVFADTADQEDAFQFSSGSLKGLMEMRDIEIPRMLEQLDQYAKTLTDTFNALHNDGVGFPPPETLTGSQEVTAGQINYMNGKVQIAVLNNDGSPVQSQFSDEGDLPPLTLDLSRLDSGSGSGAPSMQTIIDEINEYYGSPPTQKVTLGAMDDIRLAAVSDNLDGSGVMEFDFQMMNISGQDAQFDVLGVSVDAAPVAYGTFDQFTTEAGVRTRTAVDGTANDSISIDFSASAPGSTHTISVDVQVTDGDGNIYTETIDYSFTVPATGEDIRNTRYSPSAVTLAGDGTLETPDTNRRYLTASLVDADGNPAAPGAGGYLHLETHSLNSRGEALGIAIDEMDSREEGRTTDTLNSATYRGFSHFFGLNDFFTTDVDTLQSSYKNAAVSLNVRSEYESDPSRLSSGQLNASTQSSDPNANPVYTYEIGAGSNEGVKALAELQYKQVQFSATQTIPTISMSFSGYAAEMIGYSSLRANNATDDYEQEKLLYDAFQERVDSLGGVNVDEELANTIHYQNHYTASARLVNIISEMFDELLQTF